MLIIPGAMDKNLAHPIYWVSLPICSMLAAFAVSSRQSIFVTYRGKGHALTIGHHHICNLFVLIFPIISLILKSWKFWQDVASLYQIYPRSFLDNEWRWNWRFERHYREAGLFIMVGRRFDFDFLVLRIAANRLWLWYRKLSSYWSDFRKMHHFQMLLKSSQDLDIKAMIDLVPLPHFRPTSVVSRIQIFTRQPQGITKAMRWKR